ncbi:hypothetical protein HGRIS_000167 [Hohenbuehelia grisea]|uniref:Derlin n=1 Tax=Hohenbuehelia grisea TaxID=104357 RepID=A0ABR3JRL2_9AGAR
MDGFMAEIRKIPPVTRFLCASSLAMTVPVLMQIMSPYKLLFSKPLVVKRLEIWRLYTSFFLGGSGINYLFEFIMLYRTSDQLESGPYVRRSADYAWQLLVACAGIIATSMPLGSALHARPLLVCITYLSSALAPPGAMSSMFGLFTFPVAYMPYIMVGMDLLMAGPGAAAQAAAGAVVGHLWWWGIFGSAAGGQGGVLEAYGRAPGWMRWLVGENGPPPPTGAGANAGEAGGVHVIPPRRAAAASGSSSGTGYNWGSGQRLGSG